MTDHLHARLGDYLLHHDSTRWAGALGPLVAISGGWASDLYTFTTASAGPGDGPATTWVLKTYAPTAHGLGCAQREWRALTRLHPAGYPVPQAVAFEPDARHLGRPFIVMDHIPGETLWHLHEAGDPAGKAALTQAFVEALVALHALDPRLLQPEGAWTDPQGYVDDEVEQIRRDSQSSPHDLAAVVRWLQRGKHAVPCHEPALLHRDYHPWNVLVDDARHLWVIDWDWRVGDARFDLAWTRTIMQRSGFDAFSDTVRDQYARHSDRPLDDLDYFEVLATVRWLLNVLAAVESDRSSGTEAQAGFRQFLVEPVRRAQELLREHTGVDVDIEL